MRSNQGTRQGGQVVRKLHSAGMMADRGWGKGEEKGEREREGEGGEKRVFGRGVERRGRRRGGERGRRRGFRRRVCVCVRGRAKQL